jgi:hypothetical protein
MACRSGQFYVRLASWFVLLGERRAWLSAAQVCDCEHRADVPERHVRVSRCTARTQLVRPECTKLAQTLATDWEQLPLRGKSFALSLRCNTTTVGLCSRDQSHSQRGSLPGVSPRGQPPPAQRSFSRFTCVSPEASKNPQSRRCTSADPQTRRCTPADPQTRRCTPKDTCRPGRANPQVTTR